MDFLDVNPNITAIIPIPSRFYIVTTVCYGVAFIANLIFAYKRKAWHPHISVGFILTTGLIMRGITLGTLGQPHVNGLLFASYDYPRILFGTLSMIGFHTLPVLTIYRHHHLHRQDQDKSSPPLDKYLLYGSTFFSFLIIIFMICFLAKGSTLLLPPFHPPQNMQYTLVPDNAETFLALLQTYYMLFWWFSLTNLFLLFKYFKTTIRWPLMIYCIITVAAQLILTIITFLPDLQSSIRGYAITMVLQFVFLFQLPFISMMITIVRSNNWLHSSNNNSNNNCESNDVEMKP
ncbi:hypothetical protein BJ944DRAFT_122246 [Cunninghamella echinulata]|nr:hypothetical protein BJ944DRAFT_122246 [Cunninghamella echinulata]